MKDAWFVYVLRCADDTLYTGVTTDITRRLQEHNGTCKGAKYTRSRQPVFVVYTEVCLTRSAAQKREMEIKNMTRQEKLGLLNS